ncbi:MAG TPA: HAMP domain-containing methyl-accepting chemotaxis protein [Methylomusa anaerophila]|uniref:Methyl-accepting chemotaxis protein McpA n=1 Tax=Methylomusa anaerophila TaxID=1930071 RepID=A0A348AI47_9FIRM|nr:HAMP domain-containing methyl-accepting chemotaxis protein [Methylomusa anaerophila]BBB90745.1 methyl-accepting chemotaxis protein McpA [Methylomusa anaerophila]HML88652.1 HAMP domain-containing methyl-accepting chemotaxis protein [Methylomusa anaerophila]
MKLSVSKKIILGFFVNLLLIGLIAGGAFWELSALARNVGAIGQDYERSSLAVNSDRHFKGAVAAIRGYIAYGEEKFLRQVEENLEKALEEQNRLLALARPEEKAEVQKLIDATTKYKAGLIDELSPVINAYFRETAAGNQELARQHKDKMGTIATGLVPFTEQISKITDDLSENNGQVLSKGVTATIGGAQDAITIAAVLSVLSFIIGIALAIIIPRAIRRPITAMLAGTQKFAAGDWRDQINVSSNDELGQLATALNTMRDGMYAIIRDILKSSEQVASSSEELTASSEQSAQAANQIASSINGVASGANEQLAAANDTAAVVEQMSASIQQVAANANQVADQSVQAAEKAKEGGKAVDKAINQMGHIEDTVNTSAKVVAKLGERSQEIGQIVDTIAGIAGQTNLLALNAAIEAARAGEQGRGFAVVAEEVRQLAEQSQEAAKKIAELIGEIQGDTDKAVVAMDEGTREVKTGAEVVNAAGTAFREIAELVTQVSGQVKEISAAIQQMASGSQQIVDSVKKIDELSKSSAGETQNVSAATEEQLASMEEIATSSEALAKLAQELQAAVARFRL